MSRVEALTRALGGLSRWPNLQRGVPDPNNSWRHVPVALCETATPAWAVRVTFSRRECQSGFRVRTLTSSTGLVMTVRGMLVRQLSRRR